MKMIMRAEPAWSDHTDRMRFIDHQHALVLLFRLNEFRQIGNITVHAVHAFDNDQHALMHMTIAFQQIIQGSPVIVGKRQSSRAGELAPGNDAVMNQTVMQEQILRPE